MRYVALDNETYLISRFRPSPRAVCTSMYDGETSELWVHPEMLAKWRVMLTDDGITIIGKNIAFDMRTICATYPELLPLVFEKYAKRLVTDIGHRQQLFDIAIGRTFSDDKLQEYSLAALSMLVLDEKMTGKDGGWRLRYGELDGVPLEQWAYDAILYAETDAIQTWRIWEAQNEEQDRIVGEFDMSYSDFALSLLSTYGMRTEVAAVLSCENQFIEQKAALLPELVASGLIQMTKEGPVKKKAAAEARIIKCCEEKGIEIPRTEKGAVSTDQVACLMTGDPLLLRRSEYATAEKMLSTYVPALRSGTDGPLTTRFGFAATGRTSSSAPREPLCGMNIQNAPRKGGIRECFVPRSGYVYLAADFSGAELHTLAQVCLRDVGYSVLGDKLNAKEDVHLYVAALLLGISIEEARARYAEEEERIDEARQDAKAANFGFPGGMGIQTFITTQIKQRGKFWEYAKVQKLKQTWLEAFPEINEYFAFNNNELGPRHDAVIKIPGSGSLRRVTTFMSICNTKFQGLAAAGALAALREVVRRCYVAKNSPLYVCRPCNFVHDEIIMEIPDDGRKTERAMALKEVMEGEFTRFTPDYPVRVEPVLMRRWSKKAKSKMVEGELTVWNG